MGFFIVLILFVIIILIFSSKTFSPIPYFPTQTVDISLIVNALDLKNNQTVFDLGAGDGIVIFKAAKQAYKRRLNTKFIAVEINIVLLLIMNVRRLFHINRENIKIVFGDMFKMDLKRFIEDKSSITTIYLYISPWFLEKTLKNIKKQIHNYTIISYMYPIKSLKKKEKIVKGKNNIFIY